MLKTLRLYNISIKYKLLAAFIIASILPLIIVIVIVSNRTITYIEDKTREYYSTILHKSAIEINNDIIEVQDTMINIIASNEIGDYLMKVNYNTIQEYEYYNIVDRLTRKLTYTISSSKNNMIKGIAIYPPQNGVAVNAGSVPVESVSDFKKTSIYSWITGNSLQKWPFWKVEKEANGDIDIYAASIINSTYGSKKELGIIVIYINPDFLARVFKDYKLNIKERSFIESNYDKMILEYSNNSIVSNNSNDYYSLNKTDTHGVISTKNSKYFLYSDTIDSSKWRVVSMVPYNAIAEESIQLTQIITLIIFMSIIVCFFLAFTLASGIYSPIGQLTKVVEMFNLENLDSKVSIRGNDELGRVGNSYNKMLDYIHKLIDEIKQKEKQKMQLEINAFQSQITPHFIYNILNDIKCLARQKAANEIVDISTALIHLLRISASIQSHYIPIKEELKYLKSYITIMQIRHGHPFDVDYCIDNDIMDYSIIKFLLQPIVENSIIHGFSKIKRKGYIKVTGFKQDNQIIFKIFDNGVGICKSELQKKYDFDQDKYEEYDQSHIGVYNIIQRIKMNFGEMYGLHYEDNDTQGTTAVVNIPAVFFREDKSI